MIRAIRADQVITLQPANVLYVNLTVVTVQIAQAVNSVILDSGWIQILVRVLFVLRDVIPVIVIQVVAFVQMGIIFNMENV